MEPGEIELSKKLRDIPFERKVEFIYSHYNKQKIWEHIHPLESTKSMETSIDLRETGNKLFRKGHDKDALRLYTESASMAFPNTTELSLAFANRSAVLFRMGNYQASIQDINRALNMPYPHSLRSKLLKRKETCLTKIEEENKVKISLLRDIKINKNESCDLLQRKLGLTELKANETEPIDPLCPLPVIKETNDLLPNTTSKVKLEFNSTYGYHVLASKNIQAGEIITYENAFSFILDPKFRLTNCSFCFTKNDSLIPCNGCSLVMYCGERCRNDAFNKYHRIECEVSAILKEVALPQPYSSYYHFLSLRTLLIGSEQGIQIKYLMNDPELLRVLKMENNANLLVGKKLQVDYVSICNLYRDLRSLPDTAVFEFSFRSACYLHILKRSSFLMYSQELTEEQAFVGTLLLNHFLIVVFNTFGIMETVTTGLPDTYTIGACLFAFCSRFNHSCDPNANFYSNKNSMVIYSQRPIFTREQVFVSYETRYYDVPLPKRRASLSQYGFVCECRACKAEWPLYNHLPRMPTLQRNITITMKSLKMFYEKYGKLWSGGRKADVFNGLLRFLYEFSEIVQKNFKPPLQLQVACQEGMEKLIATYGNFYVDSSDIEQWVYLLAEYIASKANVEGLSIWVRDFLLSIEQQAILC